MPSSEASRVWSSAAGGRSTAIAAAGADEPSGWTLAEDHEVDGLALPAGSRVGFYEEIRKLADLAVPLACTIAGVDCITGQALRFDDAGAVIEVGQVSDEYFRHDYLLVDGDEPYIDR